MIKSSVIVGIITTTILLGSTQQIAATTTGFTGDDFTPYRADRPAINPDFDPDESCLYDAYQKRCIPGSEQACPKPQFGNNEEDTCFPKTLINGKWEWKCPEGYHSKEDDETGQCYPDIKHEGVEYDVEGLPICVYKFVQDCKVKSGLVCRAYTTIDPCQDIFHGFTGTDKNYKPDTDQFIVPDN